MEEQFSTDGSWRGSGKLFPGGGGVFKHNYFQGSGGLEPSPRPSRIAQEIFVNGWEMKLSPVHFKFYIWNDSELSNTKFCGTSRDKYLYLLKYIWMQQI